MRRVLALAAIAVILLTGCARSTSLTLSPDEFSQPVCIDLSPMDVELLETDRVDCDLSGTTLIFPDGTELETSEFGGAGSQSSSDSEWSYGWHSVGNYGIVATKYTASCDQETAWGSAEGIRRLREAYGDEWLCG